MNVTAGRTATQDRDRTLTLRYNRCSGSTIQMVHACLLQKGAPHSQKRLTSPLLPRQHATGTQIVRVSPSQWITDLPWDRLCTASTASISHPSPVLVPTLRSALGRSAHMRLPNPWHPPCACEYGKSDIAHDPLLTCPRPCHMPPHPMHPARDACDRLRTTLRRDWHQAVHDTSHTQSTAST